jgi:excisionase family DNA binding protein
MDKYLTVKEVAVMVQLSEQTIRRYVMRKQIPFHKIIRAVRFKTNEIQQWVEENKTGLTGSKKDVQAAGLFEETGAKE